MSVVRALTPMGHDLELQAEEHNLVRELHRHECGLDGGARTLYPRVQHGQYTGLCTGHDIETCIDLVVDRCLYIDARCVNLRRRVHACQYAREAQYLVDETGIAEQEERIEAKVGQCPILANLDRVSQRVLRLLQIHFHVLVVEASLGEVAMANEKVGHEAHGGSHGERHGDTVVVRTEQMTALVEGVHRQFRLAHRLEREGTRGIQ